MEDILSVLERCPLSRMSALRRLHCKEKRDPGDKADAFRILSNMNFAMLIDFLLR